LPIPFGCIDVTTATAGSGINPSHFDATKINFAFIL